MGTRAGWQCGGTGWLQAPLLLHTYNSGSLSHQGQLRFGLQPSLLLSSDPCNDAKSFLRELDILEAPSSVLGGILQGPHLVFSV